MSASDTARWPPPPGAVWVVDLDGVVWLAGQPIAGSAAGLARLRERGDRVVFATNNSVPTVAQLCERLARAGVEAAPEDIVSSAHAAAGLLPFQARVLVIGGPGLREAVAATGAELVDEGPAEAVTAGWSRTFNVDEMTRAMRAVRGGARLIGTNEDATYPTPDGLLPGSGAFLAAIATASGVSPEIAGKPHPPMATMITERVGPVSAVIGDRPSTDGALARRLGAAFGLVLSGVTGPEDDVGENAPDARAPDLGSLVTAL